MELENCQNDSFNSSSNTPIDDLANIPLFTRLISSNDRERFSALKTICIDLEKHNNILQQECRDYVENSFDLILNEPYIENQKCILQIFELLYKNNIDLTSKVLSKKSFWYSFFDKFLSSGKGAIKDESIILLDRFLEKISSSEFLGILMEFLTKSNLKLLKVVLSVISAKFNHFLKVVEMTSVLPSLLDKLLLSPNSEVKKASIEILKLLAGAAGENILNNLKNIKPIILDEIKSSIRNNSSNCAANKIKVEEVDLFKLSQPVSLINTFNENWCDKVLNTAKWSEKKELVDKFIKSASVPCLKQESYSHVIALAKRLIVDSNIQVQIVGIKIFEVLASGLRIYAKSIIKPNFGNLVHKLRETKGPVVDATISAICKCFYVLSIDEMNDELTVFVKQRNKNGRLHLLKIISEYAKYIYKGNKENKKNSNVFNKHIGLIIKTLYDDPDIEVKKLTNDVTLTIKDIICTSSDSSENENQDWRNLKQIIGSDKIKEVANIRTKSETSLASLPQVLEIEQNYSSKKPSRALTMPSLVGPKNNSPNKSAKFGTQFTDANFYAYRSMEFTEEEFLGISREFLDNQIIVSIQSTDTKIRAEGLAMFAETINNADPLRFDSRSINALCLLVKKCTKDFKELNFFIVKEIFSVFKSFSERLLFVEDLFYHFAALLTKKITESKCKQFISLILKTIRPKLIPRKFLWILLLYPDFLSTPKHLIELLGIVNDFIDHDSLFNFNDLKKVLLAGLNCAAAEVRTSAISFLKNICSDLNSAHLKEIVSGVSNAMLSKQLMQEISIDLKIEESPTTGLNKKDSGNFQNERGTEHSTSLNNNGGEKKSETGIELPVVARSLKSSDWKIRKEGLDNFLLICTDKPQTMQSPLAKIIIDLIIEKIKDSSKVVSESAIVIFNKLFKIDSMGLKPFCRAAIPSLLESLSDKKESIKNEANSVIENLIKFDFESTIISASLKILIRGETSEMKIEVLGFLKKHLELLNHSDKSLLADSVISLLLEKQKSVREKMVDFCRYSITILNEEILEGKIRDQKPFLQEGLRASTRKFGQYIQTNVLDQLEKLESSIRIMPSSPIKQIAKQRSPQDALHATQGFQKQTSDIDTALRLLNEKDLQAKGPIYLNCITEFSEPLETELNQLKLILATSFSDSLSKGLFSLQSNVVQSSIEKLMSINVFSKSNILKLFQFIYVRIFESHRKVVLQNIEFLIRFLLDHLNSMCENLNSPKESLICVSSLLRFSCSYNQVSIQIIESLLKLIGSDRVYEIVILFLGNPILLEHDDILLQFIETVQKKSTEDIPIELMNFVRSLEYQYPKISSRIINYKALLNKPTLINGNANLEQPIGSSNDTLLKTVKNTNTLSFDEIFLFAKQGSDEINIVENLNNILPVMSSKAKEIFLMDSYNSNIPLKNLLSDKFMTIFQKIAFLRNLTERVEPELLIEFLHTIFSVFVKLDQEKEKQSNKNSPTFQLIDSTIKFLNNAILKILEYNHPTSITELLLKVLMIIKNDNYHRDKHITVIVRCLVKLTKAFRMHKDDLRLPVLLNLFSNFLIFEQNLGKSDSMEVKAVNTLILELVKLKIDEIKKVVGEFAEDKKTILNQIIERCVQKTNIREKSTSPLKNVNFENESSGPKTRMKKKAEEN